MFKNITIKKSTHEQKSRAFLDFAYAEFSSAIEMLQAAKLTNNKKLSKGFIDHSLDEFKHTLFFLRSLDSFNIKNDNNNKYKFDSKLVYKLGFMNSDYFLFDKYNLSEFSMFVAVNEEQALKLFTKIKESNFIEDIKDQKLLEQIILDEKEHLDQVMKSSDFEIDFDNLLKDEKKHTTLSHNFSKKNLTKTLFYFLKLKFLFQNKIRHLFSSNKTINSFINFFISMIIIVLVTPFVRFLNYKEKPIKIITFSKVHAKLYL